MTPEEAINLIQTAKAEVEWNYPMEYVVAFDKAINALEKQVKYKWHDLRKNPEDLPSKEGYYFCKVGADYVPYRVMKYEVYELYAEDANRWHEALYPHTVVYNHFVLAWREIEPFEEDE